MISSFKLADIFIFLFIRGITTKILPVNNSALKTTTNIKPIGNTSALNNLARE